MRSHVDLDTYAARHWGEWERLDSLARRAGRNPSSLTPADIGELVSLYGRVSTHLSYIRTNFSDREMTGHLSTLLARTGASVHGVRPRARTSMAGFFSAGLPAAVWHLRYFVLASAALTFVPAVTLALWLTHSPAAVHSIAPPADLRHYVQQSFGNYYRSAPAIEFAFHVYVNNVLVSLLAFSLGVFACLPAAYVLVVNGLNLGVAAGLLTASGDAGRFWVLVLPHGMVELTSVVLAGAAGLRLGWSVLAPGDRPRATALAEEGRRAVVVLVGVVLSLAIAGAIEGTVTGSTLPSAVRVGIGALAEGAILFYLVALGRQAHARGLTGSLGESAAPSRAPRAAAA